MISASQWHLRFQHNALDIYIIVCEMVNVTISKAVLVPRKTGCFLYDDVCRYCVIL